MANKRELPRDMSFVDRQGNVVHPSREDYNARKSAKAGKAYAFFDCDASRKDIENELPHIRQISQTPNELELLLCEGTDELIFDEDLQEKLQYPDDYRIMSEERMKQGYEEERRPLGSLRYVMIGSFPGESNERVAGELGNILNYVGYLNQDQSIFRGAITYEKNGEYVLRE